MNEIETRTTHYIADSPTAALKEPTYYQYLDYIYHSTAPHE